MEHVGFPSDETLAAFIDGRLDPATRRAVIEHLAQCSECYSVFMAATADGVAAAPPVRVQTTSRAWYAVGATAVAAAIAIVLLVTPIRDRLLHRDEGIESLARAAPDERTVDGRLTGFPYQRQAAVKRGTEADPLRDPRNAALFTAAAHVQRSASERPTIDNLHALGVANLLLGNADAAIDVLHRALLEQTGQRSVPAAIDECRDAALLGDLSAALAARAQNQRRLADAAEAVRCAERAWREGKTPEAAWNRAVAVEALNGRLRARAAWRDYLAIDATSPWAAEARQRMQP
jgi:tetratricopeptide (TPR) repeat protein